MSERSPKRPHYSTGVSTTTTPTFDQERTWVACIQRGQYAAQIVTNLPAHPAHHTLQAMVQAGEAAREQLITANLRLVGMVVRAYPWADARPDLMQAGIVGLIEAIDRFDPQRGTRLSTYAVPRIRHHVRMAQHQQRVIRLPAHMEARRCTLARAVAVLHQVGERPPTDVALAAYLGWSVRRVRAVQHTLPPITSLDAPVIARCGEETTSLSSVLAATPDSTSETDALLLAAVWAAVDTLPEQDRTLLRLRYGLEGERRHTLAEIGQRLGCTRERVGQRVRRALKQVKTTVVRWGRGETH